MPEHSPLVSTIVVGLVLAFGFGAVAHRAEDLAAGRLPARGRGDRAVHARIRGRSAHRQRPRRHRRDPADVRRRAAVLDQRAALGPRHRDTGRAGADRGRDRARCGAGVAARLGHGRGNRVRRRALGRQYRGRAAQSAGTAPARHRARPHRGRLAGGRGPRDGARAGVPAGARRPRQGRRRHPLGHCASARHHARQIPRLRGADVAGRPPRDPVAVALRRAYRLARAVPPLGAGDRARRRLRRLDPVRRVLRARRVLRRHDPRASRR